MKLYTREWGTGDQVAVLVHGLTDDSRTWHRVAPRLAERGYRVLAVDLRGHGHSPRGSYSPQEWADDLAETLPTGVEVVLGHSLGAVVVALAVDRIVPGRVVYCDPAWLAMDADPPIDLDQLATFKTTDRAQIAARNPRWDEADIDVEVATLERWDPATIEGAKLIAAANAVPDRPTVPSLVQLASESFLFFAPTAVEEMQARGLEVRVVPGVGHCIHRDSPDAFFSGLQDWL